VIITVAALLGLGLRVFQLTRPGYLTGFTQYDDGVYIGNALRLVNGVIPYRDFRHGAAARLHAADGPGRAGRQGVRQRLGPWPGPGCSPWARDTANVVLAGLLVRHRARWPRAWPAACTRSTRPR